MLNPRLLRDEFESVNERLATRGKPENFDALDKSILDQIPSCLEVSQYAQDDNNDQ